MNRDIRLVIGYFDHPKTIKLKRILGLAGVESHIRLLMFAAQYKPSGVFTDMTADDIEIAGNWTGAQGALVEQLHAVRFLEKDGETYRLHDWEDHNGYASGSQDRSDKSRFSRLAHTHPHLYRELKSKGIDAISAEDYRNLTTVKRPLNESLTKSSSERISPLPSPSPSLLPSKKEKNILSRKKSRDTSFDHSYFTGWWCFSFSRSAGAKFVFEKKHAGIIQNLLKQLSLEELLRRACVYLTLPEDKRWPRGAPTIEGLSSGINSFAGKCNPEIEAACCRLGILPDEGVTLENFTPWRDREDRQLSQN